MWSRSGENNEKYVKKAARYFQYICTDLTADKNIAGLALIADDNILDAFTRPSEIPCVEKWVQMCKNTAMTLAPVSNGLLEAVEIIRFFTPEDRALASENELRLLPWASKQVRFVHRSAQDFLDSAEGKELFGKFTLEPDLSLSLHIKAQLALLSVLRKKAHHLHGVWSIFKKKHKLHLNDANWDPQPVLENLSLVHEVGVPLTNPGDLYVRPTR